MQLTISKFYLTFIGILISCSFLFAQTNTFKIEGGVSSSTVKTLNIPDFTGTNIYNFYVSAGVGRWVTNNLEVYLDGQFQTKGYTARFGVELTDVTVHNFNYINLIPQIKYKPIRNFAISGGLNLGVKLIEKFREANINLGPWKKTNMLNTFDLSYVIGAHYHFNHFYFKVMLDKGLINLSKLRYTDEQGQVIENTSIKNQSIQIGLGYYILG